MKKWFYFLDRLFSTNLLFYSIILLGLYLREILMHGPNVVGLSQLSSLAFGLSLTVSYLLWEARDIRIFTKFLNKFNN